MIALAGVTSALGPKVKPGWPGGPGSGGVLVGGVAHTSSRSWRGPAVEVGSLRAGDDHVDEAADREVGREVHDAVDLGRLVHGAAPARRVDEHLAHLADQGVALGRGDGVLQLGALAQALEGELGRRPGRRSPAAWVPSSLEKGKNPAQSSWASSRNCEQQVVVALGLAGVAEDERGAEGGVRRRRP